ncbi:hypothetical protein ACQY0O_004420 [Thecaphora frezii]
MVASPIVDLPDQGTIRPRRVYLSPFLPGRQGGSVLAYHGIPFAQPPTGQRRWRLPQGPLPRWSGQRKSQFPHDPVQDFSHMEGMMYGRHDAFDKLQRGEDCLYLHVWVPEQARGPDTPVLVWVYGGAFVVGNTSRPMYDPARLALESGCIVIALTYRVGALGFLGCCTLAQEGLGDHPIVSRAALTSSDVWDGVDAADRAAIEKTAGNWGFWDLVAGLLWVQHSIRHFGGNANNVALFGESAGSVAIHYLLLSPVVPKGLFHKAILQSGVVTTGPPATATAAQANYDYIVAKLVPRSVSGEQEQLDYLRTHVPAAAISTALREIPVRRPRCEYPSRLSINRHLPERRENFDPARDRFPAADTWGPVWDDALISRDVLRYATSPLSQLPWLRNGLDGVVFGYTADEGTLFNILVGTPSALVDHFSGLPRVLQRDMESLYSLRPILDAATDTLSRQERDRVGHEAYSACATYTGDMLFHAPVLSSLYHQACGAGQSVPVYGYAMTHRPSEQWLETICSIPEVAERMGSFHSLEIGFVFGFTGTEEHTWVSSADEYGEDVERPPPPMAGGGAKRGKGMTEAERRLSLDFMERWADLARSNRTNKPRYWQPIVPPSPSSPSDATSRIAELGDIQVTYFADSPQISPRHPTLLALDGPIEVGVKRLKELEHFATSPLLPSDRGAATMQQRVAFWMTKNEKGTTPLWTSQYGWDATEPAWCPWK